MNAQRLLKLISKMKIADDRAWTKLTIEKTFSGKDLKEAWLEASPCVRCFFLNTLGIHIKWSEPADRCLDRYGLLKMDAALSRKISMAAKKKFKV